MLDTWIEEAISQWLIFKSCFTYVQCDLLYCICERGSFSSYWSQCTRSLLSRTDARHLKRRSKFLFYPWKVLWRFYTNRDCCVWTWWPLATSLTFLRSYVLISCFVRRHVYVSGTIFNSRVKRIQRLENETQWNSWCESPTHLSGKSRRRSQHRKKIRETVFCLTHLCSDTPPIILGWYHVQPLRTTLEVQDTD